MTMTINTLDATLGRYWWAIAIRGLLAILFGILTLLWPALTAEALVLLFGAYVLTDGVVAILASFRSRSREVRWWAGLLEGLAGVATCLLTLAWPEVTALALLYLIAGWVIVTGALKVWSAVQLRRELGGEWLPMLSGLASLIFGVLLVIQPAGGALTLVWLIGFYALIGGAMLVVLGFRLRGRAAA